MRCKNCIHYDVCYQYDLEDEDDNEMCALYEKQKPYGEWIPVSERLPEEKINPVTHDFEEVLCTTIWGDVRHYKYGTPVGFDEAHFWYGFGIFDEEVVAWMPLPEPYKEEGEAENDNKPNVCL